MRLVGRGLRCVLIFPFDNSASRIQIEKVLQRSEALLLQETQLFRLDTPGSDDNGF
jgi:hypothetical protein